MGQSASQAAAFYKQVAQDGLVYTLRGEAGYPSPLKANGRRSQPFWSSESRVKRLQKACPAYSPFEIEAINWREFVSRVIPSLRSNESLVGVNWSGKTATGYDLEPADVVANVEYHRTRANAT